MTAVTLLNSTITTAVTASRIGTSGMPGRSLFRMPSFREISHMERRNERGRLGADQRRWRRDVDRRGELPFHHIKRAVRLQPIVVDAGDD